MEVDWDADTVEILLNPRLPNKEKDSLLALVDHLPHQPEHVWIATSGSTGAIKLVALSKSGIMASAAAVNTHLASDSNDCWINPLPGFHVGGLGIKARSYLSGARMVAQNMWDPIKFCELACQHQATLSALVPAQVFDLINKRIAAPATMRAIIVGGGVLPDTLYHQALQLGWPLLPSYGLTECASQVATKELFALSAAPILKILPHVAVKCDTLGYICLKGPSLLSGYAFYKDGDAQFVDPKIEGWFRTDDIGLIDGVYLVVKGREKDFFKIGGESVSLARLEGYLEEAKVTLSIAEDMALVVIPDQRLGHVMAVASEKCDILENVVAYFNDRVLPFERIRQVHVVSHIPRTPLRKLQKEKLIQLIMKS